MNADFTAKRICPMLAVADMDVTVAFYRDVLGFEAVMQSPEYSVIGRDGQEIHLMLAADESVMAAVRGHTEIYIEVEGIERLWEHARMFKDRYVMRDLFDRDYGMTEFHVGDPNDCLVFVAEPTVQVKARSNS